MSTQITRTHDKGLYLAENRYDEPKEIFRLMGDKIAAFRTELGRNISILDAGCAAGEFLYFLNKRIPESSLSGLDLVPELVEKASTFIPSAKFFVGSVLDPNATAGKKFDVTTMCGVHSIFDDFVDPFDNVLRWTSPGGRAYLFGLFNPDPVDVWVYYRKSDAAPGAPKECGWNNFSIESVSAYLKRHPDVESFSFSPFEMPFDLEKNQADPARTWTLKTSEGRRVFVNGLSQICPLYLFEVRKKKG